MIFREIQRFGLLQMLPFVKGKIFIIGKLCIIKKK